jgi:hypothetical protein
MTAKKILSLPTNDKKIYRQILAFMNFILQISNQQLDVLAEIIRLNNEYEALPLEKRAKFILSTDMRKEMRETLGIEEKQFNGIIFKLKETMYFKEPIIGKEGILHPGLVFKPDASGFSIEVNLIKQIVPEVIKSADPITTDIPAVNTTNTQEVSEPGEFKETVFHDVKEIDFDFTIVPIEEK